MKWQDDWNDVMVPNYGTPSLQVASAKGSSIADVTGKPYLDLLAGVAVNVLGHRHPAVEEAVQKQMRQAWHVSNLYAHEPGLRLAKRLRELTGRKALFVNSGTEANEAAYKLVRRHAHEAGRDDGVVLAFEGSFHGRTLADLSLTGQPHHRTGFGQTVPGIVYVPWNDMDALEDAFATHDVVGVFFETIQGEGGIRPMEPEVARTLQDLAQRHDTLLVADEVQTGIGRTGSLWGHDHLPLEPHIITVAKGLGGGWPIGACLVPDTLADTLGPGTHGCTFGGHPVAAAAATATLDALDDEALTERASRLGQAVTIRARQLGLEPRGQGLLIGFSGFDDPNAVRLAMQDAGYLVGVAGGDTVRISPPLNVPAGSLLEGVEELAKHA